MMEDSEINKSLVEKLEWKRQLGKPCRRWYDNNNINVTLIKYEIPKWIQLAHDTVHWRSVMLTVMNILVY
jgi:hypothetical protein